MCECVCARACVRVLHTRTCVSPCVYTNCLRVSVHLYVSMFISLSLWTGGWVGGRVGVVHARARVDGRLCLPMCLGLYVCVCVPMSVCGRRCLKV